MPPLAFVSGTARVVVQGTYASDNRQWVNIFHVRRSPFGSALSQAEVDAIASGVSSAYRVRFIPSIANGATLQRVEATDLTSDLGLVGVDSTQAVGQAVPPFLSQGTSMVISWKQASHYRGGHPRTYLPLHTAAQAATSSRWSSGAAAAVDAAADLFITDVAAIPVTGTAALVLVRRVKNKVTLVTPEVHNITVGTVDLRLDTQRRRLGPDI